MWYEEQFRVLPLPVTHQGTVNQAALETMLNELGREGWDVQWANREDRFLVMNKQRQVRSEEKIDAVVAALASRGLAGVGQMHVNVPNPQSDDGRIEYVGSGALREIVRLVLEES